MTARTALVIYGTRPEAIKMAPVVTALERSSTLRPVVAVTGQHREMLDQVNTLFGITPQHDLDIIRPRQQLHEITSRALDGLTATIRAERPDMVIVQGDTTTAFVAALAAFYEQVPVAHVEAGLRTSDRYNPFPEEINRRLASQLASTHLAPTPTSRANLLAEGIAAEDVYVTGNTVIDALLAVVDRRLPLHDQALSPLLDLGDRKAVLITSHRRESWGAPMACTARAIARLARSFPDVLFVLPAHLNPAVREVLLPPLTGLANIVVTDPLGYSDFARAMDACSIMLTDSGGVQEEAPSLGKPVLVLRETTERPEAVDAGTVRLVGTDEEVIVDAVSTLLTDETAYKAMAQAVNPYGDGRAAGRIVDAIAHHFGDGPRPDEFVPPPTEG
ncbi:non-hydrolyzing UDP-N-acetylglucosamine 2-epimerase [Aeromicrobium wangtongii]|uniref:UDP-N-acetylglucosamine 2-epimerase (non-hydrolyzing) n=1 Tax=Aeromicrobium wangtongii TaxID=2969247 RepID=A0ABY5M8C9_9ACTN|nr:UDP-N-acetylglucosamine 2-epimerase (non-hydrolyzing) [Aeromicrobium wangtongii]MCD9196882.1 UDP-N-acetylglucosamine 2-epimerase (non-hydrolyzing) [Aeromicrobium wangtongii]UUP14390.1 UDP-N-acetylglucosamine 2-epimerase (non-hydrolyzing) [Aeromicrobium wangtongii]